MSDFLTRAFEKRDVSVVPAEAWRAWKSAPVASGINVTQSSALTFSAVFAAHKILAESVSMLPLFVLRRRNGSKEPATNHPLYSILHDIANPEMDAYLVRETMTAHLAGWGYAVGELDYDADGQISALWPIPPNYVRVDRDKNRQLVYEITPPDKNGKKRTLPAWKVLHLRGMSPDGINGYSTIKLARQGIGLALAAEAFGGAFFGNGAAPSGVLKMQGKLKDPDARQRLKDEWHQLHQGVDNAQRVALLEEGMDYQQIGLPPEDAQFLQTRAFQVEEISRWYRIPLTMLAMTDKTATYASVEAFGLQFVLYTLYPWLVRWEKAINAQMLLERERKRYFAEHLMTALLRGDTAARNQAYAIGRQWGWLSVNDIRDMENMNPIDGGDQYLVPLNMVAAGNPGQTRKIQHSYQIVFADAIARILKRESNDLRGAIQKVLKKRGVGDFAEWVSEFYNEHQDFIVRQLKPATQSYAELLADGSNQDEAGLSNRVDESLRLFAIRRAQSAQEQLRAALSEPEPAAAIETIFETWDEAQADKLARIEISRQAAFYGMPKEL